MKRLSGPYRLFAVVALTAFAWAIVLPMMHLVCATVMDASMIAYAMQDGRTGHRAQDDDSAKPACHRPAASSGQESDSRYATPHQPAPACCLLEVAPVRQNTPPAPLLKTLTISVAVADAGVTPPTRPIRPISAESPPLLAAPSHLHFSVLLI